MMSNENNIPGCQRIVEGNNVKIDENETLWKKMKENNTKER